MSKIGIHVLVIGIFSLPFIGIGMAFYTGTAGWLALLIGLVFFL